MPGNLGLARGAKFHHRCSFVRSMRLLGVLVVASPKLWLAKLQLAANTRFQFQPPARRKEFGRPEQGGSDHSTVWCHAWREEPTSRVPALTGIDDFEIQISSTILRFVASESLRAASSRILDTPAITLDHSEWNKSRSTCTCLRQTSFSSTRHERGSHQHDQGRLSPTVAE